MSKGLSLEEGVPAAKVRKRLGLMTGRLLPGIGTTQQERPRSLFRRSKSAPADPAEHALMEAAIQLDHITPEQAEALAEKGKTLEEWLVENKKAEAEPARSVRQRMLDRVAVFALLLLNFVVLAGIGWIILRVLR